MGFWAMPCFMQMISRMVKLIQKYLHRPVISKYLQPMQRKTPQLTRSVAIPHGQERPIKTRAKDRPAGAGIIKAPLPGIILEVMVKEGEDVSIGQSIIKMEAMKMENNIQSNREGKIKTIKVKPGDSVLEGDVLVEIGE